MTPDTGRLDPGTSEPNSGWLARTPLWARIAVPVVVIAGGAAVLAAVVAAGAQPPATVESMCRSTIVATLESRGHSEIEVSRSLKITEADGAQRVSGTVTSVDDSGRADHAQIRCVVRVDGDTMHVVSARLSD
ncbi:hypothetical protein LQ757_12460 [Agromyces sp. SYSU K20354]|uniref:hypothetical protein n=1 Tax=Agromyces cavernae TaxID=2898659 RepID=UPI001E40AE9C|nr:hypothetical protein [Agromyces cavernae]MCD2443087.1 hypothetical protein [Agromyces cavernae]